MDEIFTKLNFIVLCLSTTGTQTVSVGTIELESVVPNSVPETFINVRGQSLGRGVVRIKNEPR